MVEIMMSTPIEIKLEMKEIPLSHRPYLGYSQIGHPCARFLWYSFHWAYKSEISPRVQRLFQRGHDEELIQIADLIKAGCDFSGSQDEIVGIGGHVKGHIDGLVSNVPGAPKTLHLYEGKTANDKRFKEYCKIPLEPNGHANTRLKRWSPTYYAQVNAYMGKMKLTRCLFVVTNKNNEARKYDRIHFDKAEYELNEEKALTILTSEFPLTKLGESTWFECKYCNARSVCHFDETPERNCRTCEHACIENDGVWSCEKHGQELSVAIQRVGCQDGYELMNCLKPNAGMEDASD